MIRHFRVTLAALAAMAAPLAAQDRSETTTDAAILRDGGIRIRALGTWIRFDELFGVAGTSGATPLGGRFSSANLDATALPMLQATESAVQALSGSSTFTLSAGAITTTANARVFAMPIVAEYGWSDRLMLSLVVPVMQTRATVVANLNPTVGGGNVGANPAGFFASATAYQTNNAIVTALRGAATQLTTRINSCNANPAGAGCAALLARRAEADALILSAGSFATAADALYGTNATTSPGAAFVPITGSDAQTAIDERLTSMRATFTSFGVTSGSGSLAAAGGPAAFKQLQRLLNDPRLGVGRDTIGAKDRVEIGDIELGATFQLKNTLADTASRSSRGIRTAVQGVVRLPTGRPAHSNRLFDVGSGDGQLDVEARGVVDLRHGKHWMTTLAAQYVAQLGSVDVNRPAFVGTSLFPLGHGTPGKMKLGDIIGLDVRPRYALTDQLMLDASYAFRRRGADEYTAEPSISSLYIPFEAPTASMDHRVGFGFSYSSVAARHAGMRGMPIELFISHQQTVYGSGGPTPKLSRDQVELRYYLGARR